MTKEPGEKTYLPYYVRRLLGIVILMCLISIFIPDFLGGHVVTTVPINFSVFFVVSIMVTMVNEMGDKVYNLTVRVLVNILNMIMVFFPVEGKSEEEKKDE